MKHLLITTIAAVVLVGWGKAIFVQLKTPTFVFNNLHQ